MERRKALKFTTALLGVSIVGGEAFLLGCKAKNEVTGLFSSDDVLFLDEVGETILPESDRSPGAKAAQVGEFMKTMITDCYTEAEQKIFIKGIETIDQLSERQFGGDFTSLSPMQRHDLLSELDNQAKAFSTNGDIHFFSMMKQLTILGFFTSEIGVTQALRYNPIPGDYDGCAEYKPGDSAWQGPLSSLG